MSFIPLTSELKSEWDDLVYRSPDAWVFSLSDWLDMVCAVWKMEDCSFALRENGRVVAAVPLQWIRQEKRLSSGGWGHGGIIISSDISSADRRRLWKTCWMHVEEMALDFGAESVTASISPLCKTSLENIWGVNPLVISGFEDVSTHARILNIAQSEEKLWFGLAKDARQKIKQARAAGYSVRKVLWQEMVNTYYLIHQENYNRTGAHPLPKAYFDGIARMPEKHFVLWAGFDSSNAVVAFHNNARFGAMGMYHTGCSKTEHLDSGINYLLFWEALCNAKTDGLEWYEIGEMFPQMREGKDKGLTNFKSKFGGELHRLFRGKMLLTAIRPTTVQEIKTVVDAPAAGELSSYTGKQVFSSWLETSRAMVFFLIRKTASFFQLKNKKRHE